jgi:hypothetical protein
MWHGTRDGIGPHDDNPMPRSRLKGICQERESDKNGQRQTHALFGVNAELLPTLRSRHEFDESGASTRYDSAFPPFVHTIEELVDGRATSRSKLVDKRVDPRYRRLVP